MRNIFATAALCSMSLCLFAGCTPKNDDDVDTSLAPVVIDDNMSGNATSGAMMPGGNMTSGAMMPGGNMTSTADMP